MNGGDVENTNSSREKLHPDRNKCFANDKLCLLSVKQVNQTNIVTCSQSKLKFHRHAQNNLIISMLKLFETKVSKFLEQCREEIRVVQEHIAMCRKGDSYCRAPFDCPYCPDFKISRLFGSLSNADTTMKKANQELRLIDMVNSRTWSEFHRSKLEEAIVAIETEKKIKEARQEIECLQKTVEQTEDPEKKAEIERKLRVCLSSDEIFKMTPENLCTDLATEYDWASISSDVFREHFTPEECCAMWHSYLHPKINKTPWTVKEKMELKELTIKYRFQDWDNIAAELGTGRSALQCIVHYFNDKHTLFEGRWSKHENRLLKNAVKELAVGSSIPWHMVANYLPGRNKKQVWSHWTYSVNPLIKKGTFTKEEDMLLVAAVRKHGKKFDKVAEMFKDRTSAQLRHRYTLVLEKPKLNVKWSPQDDALLLQLVKKHGEGKWKEIADHFFCFNRTQVRHHYNVLKKRQPATSEEEYLTDEDCFSDRNLIAATSSLVYGTSSNVDKAKRCKLQRTLLPFKRCIQDPVIPLSADFKTDCFSYFNFMHSNPYPKEMKTHYENEQIESKFHWLSCALYILQARLLIPGYNNPLLSHHLLSDTDRQIISLLRDRDLVTEKETTTNGLLSCKIEPVNEEEPIEDYQYISVLSEADSANSNSVKFTMPLNHTTLTGFQYSSSYCEFLKKKIAVDVMKYEGSIYPLFEQRLFCLFFWPILASEIKPHFTGRESSAEQPKVRKRVPPSRIKKRRNWHKSKKDADAPQRMKRKYVKSGKYKKEHSTEVSGIRRSSRVASTSVS